MIAQNINWLMRLIFVKILLNSTTGMIVRISFQCRVNFGTTINSSFAMLISICLMAKIVRHLKIFNMSHIEEQKFLHGDDPM